MTTDWYIKNLAWLRVRDEQLYKTFYKMAEPRPEVDWSLVDQMMRPKEWLFGQEPYPPNATLLFYGFGDGSHLMCAMDKLSETGGHLIAVVCDLAEFLEMMHIADMEGLLSDRRLHIVVLGINDDMLVNYLVGCIGLDEEPEVRELVLPYYEETYPEGLTIVEQTVELVLQWLE